MRAWVSLSALTIAASRRPGVASVSTGPVELPAHATPGTSTLTGTNEVNHPTVSARSAPDAMLSSRPWFSIIIDTGPEAGTDSRTASASAAASTVSGRAPNDSVTVPSTRSARPGSTLRITETVVASRSRARSMVNSGGTGGSCRVHQSISAVRSASSARTPDQRRNEVPDAVRAGDSPLRYCHHARPRPDTMVGHDTASTPRWWAATTTRPVPSANRTPTAASNRPSAGDKVARARECAARMASSTTGDEVVPAPGTSARSRISTVTSPGSPSPARIVGEPSASRRNDAVSIGWAAATAVTTARIAGSSASAGSVSTVLCEKSAMSPGSSASSSIHAAPGVSSTGPTAPPGNSSRTASGSVRAAPASSRIVDAVNTSRGVRCSPAARNIDVSRMDAIESPPSSKNERVSGTSSSPSTDATMAATICSDSPTGAESLSSVPDNRSKRGRGSDLRSSLPVLPSGASASGTQRVGRMYAGNDAVTASRARPTTSSPFLPPPSGAMR